MEAKEIAVFQRSVTAAVAAIRVAHPKMPINIAAAIIDNRIRKDHTAHTHTIGNTTDEKILAAKENLASLLSLAEELFKPDVLLLSGGVYRHKIAVTCVGMRANRLNGVMASMIADLFWVEVSRSSQ